MAAPAVDDAFEDLYASYGREVYRYALALLRNPAEAEDVTQTTFLNAYRALRAGARPRRPHNWLIAITHNVCRSRVRFAMRRPREVPLDDVVEQLAVPEAERPNVRELMRTIRRLPLNQRAAITMRELEGRTYVDIAETLGVTVPAAEALIGRARRTLRAHAAAFRGLLLLPLPRSLRKLAENGEAAGGALGSAAAAKVVALIVIGAVGGGVGVAAGGGSDPPSVQAVPRAAAQELASRSGQGPLTRAAAGAPLAGRGSTPAARTARQEQQLAQLPPGATAVAATAQAGAVPASSGAVPTAASAAGTTAAAAVTSAAGTAGTVGTVGTTVANAVTQVTQAITTVAAHLPTVTTPTVTTPSATTPRVTTPTVTTPVTTVPPVTAPTVTVPSVTVPTVTIP